MECTRDVPAFQVMLVLRRDSCVAMSGVVTVGDVHIQHARIIAFLIACILHGLTLKEKSDFRS